jgi:hypothetical protein
MFENKVLRGISRSKRDEVRGSWIKLHSRELNDFYSSPTKPIIITVESVRITLAEHIAYIM